MRILVVGAGAIGGYFGARLAAVGRDVTFLVRPKRAEQLASGLVVRSPKGDVTIAAPKLVTEATLPPVGIPSPPLGVPSLTAQSLAAQSPPLGIPSLAAQSREPFDLVLLSCKSYDLASAMDSFARAVGPKTLILPLLNGESHIDTLKKRFGAGAVLGGQCQISSTLDEQGHVIHLNDWHTLGFGELDGTRDRAVSEGTPSGGEGIPSGGEGIPSGDSARIEAVNESFSGANFEAQLSLHILHDMWEKWVFIATMAGITCLMRAAVGDIEVAGGTSIALELFEECSAIAGKNGYTVSAVVGERIRKTLSTPGSTLMASMLRDVEGHRKTEHEHVLGELLARGQGARAPVLETCLANLRAYEARRLREAATTENST
jgi:2-dehydropantoate 2-reductase